MALPPVPPSPAPGAPGSAPNPVPKPAIPAAPVKPAVPAAPPKPAFGQNFAPKPKPKMQTAVQGDVAVVTILESRILDETNVREIGQALMDLVTKQYMIKMIIDLAEVKYLSSAVLSRILAVYKAIKAEKGDLKLCRVCPEVREVFKITQLDKMIEIKDDLESAINSFKKKGPLGFLR